VNLLLYFLQSIIRVIKSEDMELPGRVVCTRRKMHPRILVEKPEDKRLHERPGLRWENNTGMSLKQIILEAVGWIQLAQNKKSW